MKPGYRIEPFVNGFLQTPIGAVPKVSTRLTVRDHWGRVRCRSGYRADYTVSPGLHAVGEPGADSPVVVTCNYKLTFDAVRRDMAGLDAWLLVLDTRGINVWCAAGKGTFSTDELVWQVHRCRLAELVNHRRLIVPQLGATGVAAHEVRRRCGFGVVYGPVRSADLRAFLKQGQEANESMRRVAFPMAERLEVGVLELFTLWRSYTVALVVIVLLSGVGPGLFSWQRMLERAPVLAVCGLLGVLGGTVGVPALLPWLPFRAFWAKGAVLGGVLGALAALSAASTGWAEALACVLFALGVSSFLGMNYTGSTTYTSPSGVEKEMRRGIPVQLAAGVLGLLLWVAAPFMGGA